MADRRKGGPRPSRAERRRQLLDDAVAAIRRDGATVSMEQLAASGGVTKPILYRHFGDRDGLVRAIGERFLVTLLGRLEAALEAPEPRDILAGTIDAYLSFLEEDPHLYAFLIGTPQRTEARPQAEGGTEMIDVIGPLIARAIGDGLRAAGRDAGAAEPYGFGIVGMVHQAGDWWMRNKTMTRAALTNYLTDLLWHGFQGMATAAAPALPSSGETV